MVRNSARATLVCGVAIAVLMAATEAAAQQKAFNIKAQPAVDAIPEFARQAGVQIIAPAAQLRGLTTPAVRGDLDVRLALTNLLQGSGLEVATDVDAVISLRRQTDSLTANASVGAPQIEEVIVTAQRRAQRLQDTPLAISALSSHQIVDRNINTIADLQRQLPGIYVEAHGVGTQISVRGVGSNNYTVGGDPAVAINYDGVYISRPRSAMGQFFDVERVELLRGPQGTLYGRNATAGSLNIIPKTPSNEFESEASVELGNYNLVSVFGATNIPLADNLAVRVAFRNTEHDGYTDNSPSTDGNDADETSVRASIRYQPVDALTLRFTGDYSHIGGAGPQTVLLPLSAHPYVAPISNANDELSNDHNIYGGALHADLKAGPGTVSYIGSYRWDRTQVGGASVKSPNANQADARAMQWSNELRYAISTPQTQAVAGLYSFEERQKGTTAFVQNSGAIFCSCLPYADTSSWAVFGQATQALTRRVRLTAGVRYTEDHKKTEGSYIFTLPTGVDLLLSRNSANQHYNATTFKVGLDGDLNDASHWYANISTGYKAGGFFVTANPKSTFDPEKLTAYEVGIKNRWLGGRISLDASAFYYDYKDFQVSYLGYVEGALSSNTYNAQKATLYGLELEGAAQLTARDQVNIAVSLLHAEYDKFVFPAGQVDAYGRSDYSGTRLVNAPTLTATVGYQHDFVLGNGAILRPRLETRYEGEQQRDYRQLALTRQDAYFNTSMTLTYLPHNQNWSVQLWVRNLENETVLVQATPDTPATIPTSQAGITGLGYLSAPRTFGARLSASF